MGFAVDVPKLYLEAGNNGDNGLMVGLGEDAGYFTTSFVCT